MRLLRSLLLCVGGISASFQAAALPFLVDPSAGTLSLVASGSALTAIDGLAFDRFGNLLGTQELSDTSGNVVYVNKQTGAVSLLTGGIPSADQIDVHPVTGHLYVTAETSTAKGGGVYRVELGYGIGNVPMSATAFFVNSSIALDSPEGLVALKQNGGYGETGDLLVGEDLNGGRILRVTPAGAASVIVAASAGLARPEGFAYGDFGGAALPALYAAETANHRVLRIGTDGTTSVLGNPAVVGLNGPDNLEFGPDGFLYASEDRFDASSARVVRIAADGTHTAFIDGLHEPAGLAFDPVSGDLYVAEQAEARIWRLSFAPTPPVPEPGVYVTMVVGIGVLSWQVRRKRRQRVRAALPV